MLIPLDFVDLGWAVGMVAIAIALSAWQGLGLEGSIALAAGRTAIQLTLVGYLLAVVFDPGGKNPWLVLAVVAFMLATASVATSNIISKKIKNLLPLVSGAILITTALTLGYTNLLILQPDPWYAPQYAVPLAAMVLGNAMNAGAIAGERLVSKVNSSQLEIETHLSLGATPQQAIAQYRKDAIKAGLIPTLNTMTVAGIVTLPGTMTGLLLSGVSPLDAASYQILIAFLLALATLIATWLITEGLCRKFFNKDAQLINS
ncbi:MAG: iron export ABC transporter permease subunit FetB [Oscillatoriaceae cyanobacterium Prado104]|nr:iron export ABC transporter permease subunit FetB [Oscillatoriaceae cyanobacterium Prado104]